MLSPVEINGLRSKHYNATLIELFMPQKALWIFRVKPDEGMIPFKPGQYTTLGLGLWEPCVAGSGPETLKPGQEKQLLRRAYSVSHPVVDSKTGALYSPTEIDFYEFYVTLVVNESSTPMPPRLTPRIFALKKGELAQEIVTTSYGYHIIKLVDQKSEKVKDAKGKTVDQEQVRASHILFSVKSSLDSFLNDLLSEALLKSNTRIYIKVHNPFEEAKKQTG